MIGQEQAENPSFLSSLKDRVKMRLAETYLILAEAQMLQAKNTEAAANINFVRARSNASAVAADDVDMDYILDERARELLGEVHRRLHCREQEHYWIGYVD